MITFTDLELVLMGAVAVLLWVQHTTRKEAEMHKFAAKNLVAAVKGIAEKRFEVVKDKNGGLRLINLQEKA